LRFSPISAAFDPVFWDESVQAYRTRGYTDTPDDRGNAVAVCAGLVPKERSEAIAKVLENTRRSSIGMETLHDRGAVST
jgi:hypothetical protein